MVIFKIERPPFLDIFSSGYLHKRNARRHVVTSLRSCICSGQQNFVKNRVETAWILAEIEPCSFESMRNSSDSEEDDVCESQDGHRRGN